MASDTSSQPAASAAEEADDIGDEGLKLTRSSSHAYGDYNRPQTPGGGVGDVAGGGAVLPPVLVMYHPSMEAMAKKLVEATTRRVDRMKLQQSVPSTNYRRVELWEHLKWDSFKDGWPNIFINNVEDIAGRDVILLASFHSPAVVFEQLSLIYSLPRYLIRSFRLILPFFPTGTMERIDTEGQIVTAKSMASMLSGIPLAARGPTQIFIFDIHALQERFYFTDLVIPRLLSAIPLLIRRLNSLPDVDNLAIAFPDEGAWKRFHSYFTSWPTITCSKMREGDRRVIKIREGNPSGHHVVIVDDLVQTGGTLIQCAKAICEAGAAKISMYVTHAVFPKHSWKAFKTPKSAIGISMDVSNFWITDSIPHALDITRHTPFQLIPLYDVIADSLLGYDLLTVNI